MSTTVPRPGARHRRKRLGSGESSGKGKLQERGTRVRKPVREEVCDWVLKEVRCLLFGAYRKRV